MATVSAPPQEPVSVPEEQRFRIGAVDWDTYRKISDALIGRHLRITYDRGTLEFMTISSKHGQLSRLLARFIQILTEELGLPICSCGDMTCDREDLERGLEPDEGFYIENEPKIRDREPINLAVDPPPDLAVEVDLRRPPSRRLGIYAAIGVPEVWRFDGQVLHIHQRGPDGQYIEAEFSLHFRFVTGPDLVRFLEQRTESDENRVVQAFRQWVQEQIGASGNQS